MAAAGDRTRQVLLRRGFALEYVTLAWNVAGIVVLAIAAVGARSVALAGFGLDSLIEIGASTVVIWELSGAGEQRQRRGLRLIGYAFAALAVYLLVQSTAVLAAGYHPGHSRTGIIWTAVTAAVMFTLAAGKARIGRALDNPVLQTEGRVTMIDGILASAVLLGLVLNAALGWWRADPAAGYVLVYYAVREVREIFGTPSTAQLRGGGDLFSPAHSARWTARMAARNSLCRPNARRAARSPAVAARSVSGPPGQPYIRRAQPGSVANASALNGGNASFRARLPSGTGGWDNSRSDSFASSHA